MALRAEKLGSSWCRDQLESRLGFLNRKLAHLFYGQGNWTLQKSRIASEELLTLSFILFQCKKTNVANPQILASHLVPGATVG